MITQKVLGARHIARSNPGDVWVYQNGLSNRLTVWGETLGVNSVVWAGTQFCAAGDSGSIATSPDGVTWTFRPGLRQSAWGGDSVSSIVWTGTQFCVVGYYGKAATSPDGITWTYQPGLSAVWQTSWSATSVVWSGTQFCAIGYGGKVATSPDGVAWTIRTGLGLTVWGTNDYQYAPSIIWDGTKFCAANTRIATSVDGVTWTIQVDWLGFATTGIVWSGTQFCIVGNNGKVMTSPDGITWTNRTSGLSSTAWGNTPALTITWTGTYFCIVGHRGKVATSSDGITWVYQPDLSTFWDPDSYMIRDNNLAWNGTTLCLAGHNGKVATSSDGIIWYYQDGLSRSNDTWGNTQISDVAWNGSVFCVIGVAFKDGGLYTKIATSTDGVTWIRRYGLNGVFTTLECMNGQFCAIGAGGLSATSLDGINWTNSNALSFTEWGTTNPIVLEKFADRFWAIGYGGKVVSSLDGINWVYQPNVSGLSYIGISWSGTQFCAVDNYGLVRTSPDGVEWQSWSELYEALNTASGGDSNLVRVDSITWSGTHFCIISGNNQTIMTSPDGIVWTYLSNVVQEWDSESEYKSKIVWAGSKFFVTTEYSQSVFSSSDGITWTNLPIAFLPSVIVNTGNQIFIGGSGGDILIS